MTQNTRGICSILVSPLSSVKPAVASARQSIMGAARLVRVGGAVAAGKACMKSFLCAQV